MLDSSFLEFRLNYSEKKNLAMGSYISSENISAGGHRWRVNCFPNGDKKEAKGEYVSVFLELMTRKSENVKAFFDAFLLKTDGNPCRLHTQRCLHVYNPETKWGWTEFVKRSDLEPTYLMNGMVTFIFGVTVVSGNSTPLPPSEIGIHLGRLLDRSIATDVTIIVGGQAFPAHRAVLVARSPVFEAQLLGSMADASMPSITLQDIDPAAFKVMLWFIYTDSLPDDELGDSSTDMMQHLIAAADRYALDRLKIMCSVKLMELVSVDTVGSILVCAEMYNCPELKKKCLDFFSVEQNFKRAAFTDGFVILVQKFPSLAAELRKRVVI
ncbi:hypothetical protein EJB05_48156, partial [Eragrostis curvula]